MFARPTREVLSTRHIYGMIDGNGRVKSKTVVTHQRLKLPTGRNGK